MASTGLGASLGIIYTLFGVQAHLRFPDREAEGPGRNFCSLIPEGNAGVQTWSDRSKVCVPFTALDLRVGQAGCCAVAEA